MQKGEKEMINYDLTNEEQMLVNSEIQKRKKSVGLAYVLLIFLGSLGIHRFYLGKVGTAVTQLILTIIGWVTIALYVGVIFLLVVGIWLLVDLFLIPSIEKKNNQKLEIEIIQQIKMKRNFQAEPVSES
ncbi:TM2 domain protein [Listeria grayi DSM 20601]|uniref:TM2 domain protein n=2 Tax=Listeria grayi TaxID=1641 RepID=D7UYE1_LISGR|nr:TM2 domain protein [Listeria grayi DSM 20601]